MKSTINEILKDRKYLFFGYGRTALEFGYEYLGLGPGDEILYPNYICDVTVLPAKKLGIGIKYYDVFDTLEPNFESAAGLITDKTKAFLSVNYFGFPQPFKKIREFCKQYRLFYIEDNAHSSLSQIEGGGVGTFGDISIFSFRKLIPLVNGAVLLINMFDNDRFKIIESKTQYLIEEKVIIKRIKCLIKRYCRIQNYDLDKILKRVIQVPEAGSTEEEDFPYKIDKSSLSVLLNYDLLNDSIKRRFNYNKMLTKVNKDFKPIFNNLPESVVPMVCPFYTSDRDKWLEYYRRNNIKVFIWPTLPRWVANNSKNAIQIWKKIIVFNV